MKRKLEFKNLLLTMVIAMPMMLGLEAFHNEEELALFQEETKWEDVSTEAIEEVHVKLNEVLTETQNEIDEKIEMEKDRREQEIIKKEQRVRELALQSKRGFPNYTNKDLYLLASLIESEAGSSDDRTQQWVGQVVVNRHKHSKWTKPGGIRGIIFATGQYSTASNLQSPTDKSLKNAKIVLEGKSDCPTNVVYQANFVQGNVVRKVPSLNNIDPPLYFGSMRGE